MELIEIEKESMGARQQRERKQIKETGIRGSQEREGKDGIIGGWSNSRKERK